MISFLIGFLALLNAFFRSRYSLGLEILALRQQLRVLKRKHPRPRLRVEDRIFWILLRRLWLSLAKNRRQTNRREDTIPYDAPESQYRKLLSARARHTFASYLIMNGVDLKTVSELLGHADTRMTERYSHLSPKHKARAVNILDSALRTDTKTDTVEISKSGGSL